MKIRTVAMTALGGMLWAGLSVASGQAPDPAKVALGKKTFEETKCAKCHGEDGKGDRNKNPSLSLEGISAKLSATDIRKWITSPAEMTAKLSKKPKEPMKKFD